MAKDIFTLHEYDNHRKLIGFRPEDDGFVQLEHPEKYDLYNPRYFRDLVQLFSKDYQENVMIPESRMEAYAGAESKMMANVTAFSPYWEGQRRQRICPTSMGHTHSQSTHRYVELYFVVRGVAGVMTDRCGEPFVELTIACPGDFVLTEADSNMTLFGLHPNEPLVMLDISSGEHISSKDLQRNIGPLALFSWRQPERISVKLNSKYTNRKDGFGVADVTRDSVEIPVATTSPNRFTVELTSDETQKELQQLGIHIRRANNNYVAGQLKIPSEALMYQHLRKVSTSPLYVAIGGTEQKA